jgi:8-oxo-dGTP pyrophosphatase MutT (NUDIX family)
MRKPEVLSSQHHWTGRIVSVSTERLRYPNGDEWDLDFVRHPGASAVVAVDEQQRVCLVRQYRHGVTEYLWEIPAGKLDKGEAPEVCAVRELREETGVTAARWTYLGIYVPAPGIFTEVIHLYLAQDLTIGAAKPDNDEDLELAWLPIAEASERILTGEWNDGKTGFALWRAMHRLQL